MLDAFFSPGRLGDSLGARPRWFWAMALCVVLGTATGAAVFVLPQGKKLVLEELRKKMPPSEKDPTKEDEVDPVKKMWRMVVGIGIGWAVLGTPLMILLCAAVLWVVCTAILGSSVGYRHHVAVASHGYVILVLGGALSTALILARGSAQSTLSLAAFAPSAPVTSLEYRVLAAFDFFRLWWIGATGVMAARSGRLGSATVLIVLFAIYLVLAGVVVAAQSLLPQGSVS